jgi:hypothetical protein
VKEASLEQICEAVGFPVADIRRRGEVLVIVPASLAELPDRAALSSLAERLRERSGARYVTLGVDAAGDA